jgi:8-amino-7-oxononanoate synthase
LTGQQQTVLFSSGYLAGRAVADLFGSEANMYMAPNSHPAIQSAGVQLGYDWQTAFIQQTFLHKQLVLFTESVYPLTAGVNDFSFLKQTSPYAAITCVIDDSHGIGVLGNSGEGIVSSLPALPNVEYVVCYSLSKAYHVNGGAVSCSHAIATQLRNAPYYTGSTAVAPFLAHAFVHAGELYDKQREKLKSNIAALQSLVRGVPAIPCHPSLPVCVLPNDLSQAYFDKHRVVINTELLFHLSPTLILPASW